MVNTDVVYYSKVGLLWNSLCKPLNVITLGQVETDYIDQMITIAYFKYINYCTRRIWDFGIIDDIKRLPL